MGTIADPATLEGLILRLRALQPDSPRRWGTMTAGEMLCHLGDANDSVARRDPRLAPAETPGANRRRPFFKWFALRSPIPWPRGRLRTPPSINPHADGTRPADFEVDRQRVIDGLREFATAPREVFAPSHLGFGQMTREDWQCWAYRHTDHHLRQFGV